MPQVIVIRPLREFILISPGLVRVVRKAKLAKLTPYGAEKLGLKKEARLARWMKVGDDGRS